MSGGGFYDIAENRFYWDEKDTLSTAELDTLLGLSFSPVVDRGRGPVASRLAISGLVRRLRPGEYVLTESGKRTVRERYGVKV